MLLNPFMNGAFEAMCAPLQKDTTFTKIFVGGLPYHTTDASLRIYFETFGDIDEAVVIADRQTGKSRGYGFVTMTDRAAAERACKDPNPFIDGRKANVNLAFLGAKPRSLQTALPIGMQQIHPALLQRQYGLAQQYLYPQSFLQPLPMLPSHVASLCLNHNRTYGQYASAAFDQYPYSASPGFLGYAYTPSPTAHTPAPQSLSAATGMATAFLQYPPQPVQPDRLH
ncbi:hypothetical protein AAFF_G00029880 [Aldrovandia affinis]|uniref:RNA-binding protein 38 n=1 Tax=Aldrovandia affinis TaxID=143900 RepID=A0AAD7S6M1_9TELE|nr:hypothetical protein AAFF_G00029880 [Aldrovandia affinis]